RPRAPPLSPYTTLFRSIAREYRRLVKAVADDDVAEALFQIMQIAREAEDRHDFGGDGDVEAGLARKAVAVPQTRNDVAQRTVVHVHHAAPGDAARVDAEAIAPVDVVVDQGREKIMG